MRKRKFSRNFFTCSFLARVEQALQGQVVEWQRLDRQRLDALEKYATLLADVIMLKVNYDSLARACPPSAPVLETIEKTDGINIKKK